MFDSLSDSQGDQFPTDSFIMFDSLSDSQGDQFPATGESSRMKAIRGTAACLFHSGQMAVLSASLHEITMTVWHPAVKKKLRFNCHPSEDQKRVHPVSIGHDTDNETRPLGMAINRNRDTLPLHVLGLTTVISWESEY
jgi:hypothetical protein